MFLLIHIPSWCCLLFLLHAIIVSTLDWEWTSSWSQASKKENVSFDLNWIRCLWFSLFLVHAITSTKDPEWASSWSQASKEKYVFFDTNQIPDGSYYSLYMPSSSPPRMRNGHPPDSKYWKKRIDQKQRNKRMFRLIWIEFLIMLIVPCSRHFCLLLPLWIKNGRPPVPKHRQKNMFPLIWIELSMELIVPCLYMTLINSIDLVIIIDFVTSTVWDY